MKIEEMNKDNKLNGNSTTSLISLLISIFALKSHCAFSSSSNDKSSLLL